MKNDQIIPKVVEYLKEGYYDFAIEDLLKEKNIPESEFTAIIDKAKEIVFEDNFKILNKKHKFIFVTSLLLAFLTLIYFSYFLPYKIESVSVSYPILGSIIICLFSYLAIAYYKTWKLEFIKKIETPNIDYSFIWIMIIPCAILYFIISSRFESVADELLYKNQIEVTGKVISGGETEIQNRYGKATYSKIIVEFNTIEGAKRIAYEDVSNSEFQNFYLNQEINLIYSKTNPENINLLISDSDFRKFKKSKERDILPQDLINFMAVDNKNAQKELNKISYGWEYHKQKMMWINVRKNIAISLSNNLVIYIGENVDVARNYLEKDGYKLIEPIDPQMLHLVGRSVWLNKNFTAIIEKASIKNGEQPIAIITIMKK